MPKQINYDYFEWLISQIKIGGTRSYRELFERMHNTEFVWTVPNDDNRVRDGLDLRNEFLNEIPRVSRKELAYFSSILHAGASMLEILISLSRRVAFTAGGEADAWAWQLMENLRLTKLSDPLTREKEKRIDEILEAVIWRTYGSKGQGGFFPLNWAEKDQTKVELWYQMQKYVMEIQEP
jgi:hypothetical protein